MSNEMRKFLSYSPFEIFFFLNTGESHQSMWHA